MKILSGLMLVLIGTVAAKALTDDEMKVLNALDRAGRQKLAAYCGVLAAQSAASRRATLAAANVDERTMAEACEWVAANNRTPNSRRSNSTAGTAQPFYPTSERVQLSEPCPLIAKWLSQGLAPGGHWQLLSYDRDLGLLTFKILDGALGKSGTRMYLEDPKAKNVHMDEVVFTLRSLVSSSLSFEGAPASSGESCTISTALKFVSKDGRSWASNGKGEKEMLQRLNARYKEHGLDY